MNKHCRRLAASLTLVLCGFGTDSAMAVDPVCVQLKTAVDALRTVPFHLYMTTTQNITNKAMANVGAQEGIGGTKQSEEISTAKSIYVMTKGRWVDMQTSFATMEKDKDSDPDTRKMLEAARCKALPDETMYGQPARVYQESNAESGLETKVWISKSTKLPIRTDINDNSNEIMKTATVSRYEYGNAQAPANAITMAEMIKSKGAH